MIGFYKCCDVCNGNIEEIKKIGLENTVEIVGRCSNCKIIIIDKYNIKYEDRILKDKDFDVDGI
jgi:hypothetical protein